MEASTATSVTEEDGIQVLDASVEGGQIVRNSVPYCALLGKSVRLVSIRTDHIRSGLRMQHLKGVQLVRELCHGKLEGAQVSSTTMSFLPSNLHVVGTSHYVDIQTAGSITLLIQTVLPVLLFQPWSQAATDTTESSTVTLVGGTNATEAPQIDYLLHIFLPVAEKMFGAGRVQVSVQRRGYFPKGQGEVQLKVTPLAPGESLKAIDQTERGEVTRIRGYIYVGGVLPVDMAWEMQKQALQDLRLAGFGTDRFPTLESDLQVVREVNAVGGGYGLVLWAETEGGCIIEGRAMGHRTTKPKSVATEAIAQLLETIAAGGCVDGYLQDHVILLMALAKGTSRIVTGPITARDQAAMCVATQLTGASFETQQLADGRSLIECHGIGFASTTEISKT